MRICSYLLSNQYREYDKPIGLSLIRKNGDSQNGIREFLTRVVYKFSIGDLTLCSIILLFMHIDLHGSIR